MQATEPALVAVVEVPFEDRIRCSAEGCGHSVYRRVHVVRDVQGFRLYGSDCFARLFGEQPWAKSGPRYGTNEGKLLTAEERALLSENTDRLIEKFAQEEAVAEVSSLRSHSQQPAQESFIERVPQPKPTPTAAAVSTLRRTEAEAIARERLSRRFPGISLNMPGWVGLIAYETEAVLREHAA